MEFAEERMNDVVIIKLTGRLDASSAEDLKNKVASIAGNEKVSIVFDMENVDFIDSSGLGVLVASLRSVNKAGGDIKISSLQEQVRTIFELTRLHRLFEIFDDNSTAAESYQ